MAGYFNAITNLEEKRGGIARLGPSSSMLRENISYVNLIDVKPRSRIFNWNNRTSGTKDILERLDRFLVSCFWLDTRWFTRSEILDWRGSDHWPIKLSVSPFKTSKKPSFKFQLMWLRDPSLYDLMITWWYEGRPPHGTSMYTFEKRLQHVKFRINSGMNSALGTFKNI